MLIDETAPTRECLHYPEAQKHTSHRNTYIYLTLVVLLGSIICLKSPSHYLACLSSTQARVDDIFEAMQQVEGPSSRLGKGFRVNEFFYCFLYKWLFMNLSRAVTFEHTFLIPEDTKSAVVLESFQRIWKKRAPKMSGGDFKFCIN